MQMVCILGGSCMLLIQDILGFSAYCVVNVAYNVR